MLIAGARGGLPLGVRALELTLRALVEGVGLGFVAVLHALDLCLLRRRGVVSAPAALDWLALHTAGDILRVFRSGR